MNPMIQNSVDRPDGMLHSELDVLLDLVSKLRATNILEIGMANGSSTVALLECASSQRARVTSIDPFQTETYRREGISRVRDAALSDRHTLIESPDYLALPQLVSEGKQFDFIFIDGYHAFDYAMVDFFYSDLLLRVGGVVAFHDSSWPSVFHVCHYVDKNKAYRQIGPPTLMEYNSPPRRFARRLYHFMTGQNAIYRPRREQWKSVAAFEKMQHAISKERDLVGF